MCDDDEFFTHKSVQMLIDYHYYYWYRIQLYSIVIPALIQVVLFWLWNNFVLPIRLRDIELQKYDSLDHLDPETGLPLTINSQSRYNFGDFNHPFKATLFLLTLYLICYDLSILVNSLRKYFDTGSLPSHTLFVAFNLLLQFLVF